MRDTHSIRWAIIALILGGIGTACTESSIISLLPDVGPQRLGEIGPGQTVVEALQSCEAEAMQEVVDSGE